MIKDAFKMFDLTGRTALVTGGGTGLGYEMTKALVQSGARVMIAARREDVLKQAAEQLMSELSVDTVLYHGVDLMDRGSVKALADHALATLNGVDIFIGNAGIDAQQKIVDISDAVMDQTVRVNLLANVELTRELLPHMQKKKWGRVIYSSSVMSIVADAEDMTSVYGAAKNGLNAFARWVAAEGGSDGVTANSIVIGTFITDMGLAHLATLPEQARQNLIDAMTNMVFLRRAGKVEEIGGLIQLLASDAGGYITGTSVVIDGGITAAFRPASSLPPV